MTHHDRHTDADATQGGANDLFDITKQIWTFDPEDFSINVDGMWDLCYLGDPDDFPCVDDDDRPRLYAEVIACGNAIAALPKLVAALDEILTYSGGADHALDDPYVMDRARAALALATRREPSDANG
jgi:hypothetical protein